MATKVPPSINIDANIAHTLASNPYPNGCAVSAGLEPRFIPTSKQMLLNESTPECIASASIAELDENKKQTNFTSAMPTLAISALMTAINFVLSAFSVLSSKETEILSPSLLLVFSLLLISKFLLSDDILNPCY